jgi:type I restriction-modification system DNA methylase subunit
MPLFQQSVQKKFIKDLDKAKVETAYQKLIAHFGNIDVQENIRKAKEEQYQEGFLRELFVDVLGYVLNPQPNYNLITEQKNEKNSKKADGAILKNNKPIAVIELKSVKTTDLQSIEIQAFNYKNNQTECVYVVTSNFQKLRFYIENAVDFEEFDLFDLSKERFELLYLCLQVDNVLSDLPLRIKQASLEREENITKKLYADYSLFKQTLFKDISAQNKGLDKLTLFKKTQKLLDRFLFIFFAEDKGLLPPNSVSEILNQWDKLKELDAYQPLYNRFKLYFGYLNSGHVGKQHTIFAYNGGLFAPDDLLDNFKITDNILYNHCRVLSHYDFDTEVDTNILGHIFEHSLNEVDEVAANTEGVNLDKGKTKRKKDGIFYTPRYITKYIVESTIGELCKQKKLTLGLDNEALIKADTKKDRKLYQVKIDEYRKWLLQLTILDPACGSGAFLNQALEFLIQEHRLVDTMTAMLFGDSLIMTDNVTEILENNIFGVDINEESVEIARLSLWLRTAKVGRKLNDLSRHIKCGNSLVSDNIVAGDLAFDWQKAFPKVFEKGGFDVVIGNPPYVQSHSISEKEKAFYYNNYATAEYQINTYALFIEKIFSLLKKEGFYAYIVPNYFLSTQNDRKLRHLIFIKNHALEILNTFSVFESATVDTLILVGTNSTISIKNTAIRSVSPNCKSILERLEQIGNKQFSFDENRLFDAFQEDDIIISFDKQIDLKGVHILADFFEFYQGMKPYEQGKGKPAQTRAMMNDKVYHATLKIDDSYLPLLTASSIKRYSTVWEGNWIKYGVNLAAPRKKEIFEGERLLLNRIKR